MSAHREAVEFRVARDGWGLDVGRHQKGLRHGPPKEDVQGADRLRLIECLGEAAEYVPCWQLSTPLLIFRAWLSSFG